MAAVVICISCLLFTYVQQRTDKLQNKVYIVIVGTVALNALTLIVAELAEPLKNTSAFCRLLMQTMVFLYFILHAALCPMFFMYVSIVCGSSISKRKILNLYAFPFILCELIFVLNPFLHWAYYFDDNYNFTRSWGEASIYITGLLYLVLALAMLMYSWKALTQKRKIALLYFFCVVMIGVAIQLFFINIKCELFAEALALFGVMLSIESEDELIDAETGLYNRKALQNDINTYIINKRQLYIIGIRITNADIVRKAAGSENTDVISVLVSDYLKTILPRYYLYKANSGAFMLALTDCDLDRAEKTAEKMKARFEQPWIYGGGEVLLNAIFLVAEVPERITSAADALYMIDSPLPSNNDKKILVGSDLDYLLRREAVENAVTRGLKNGLFEVYYQPTYHRIGQKLHGAEALVRLHDKVIGNVYPDEFIPIAEQMGMIDRIDDFVLHEVCAFLKSGIPQKHGMDCINVNLSVIQCMRPGFVSHINTIAEQYEIDKNLINFEITESVAASDYQLLSNVVTALKEDGFRFSMDDYGTGYSNMEAIFSLDFDVVKIDKSILWSAEDTELGRIILENSIRMIRQMKREILVEGVETEKQIQLLDDLSVDYLQGYFFSKPIPKAEFIQLLEHIDKEDS